MSNYKHCNAVLAPGAPTVLLSLFVLQGFLQYVTVVEMQNAFAYPLSTSRRSSFLLFYHLVLFYVLLTFKLL